MTKPKINLIEMLLKETKLLPSEEASGALSCASDDAGCVVCSVVPCVSEAVLSYVSEAVVSSICEAVPEKDVALAYAELASDVLLLLLMSVLLLTVLLVVLMTVDVGPSSNPSFSTTQSAAFVE